MSVFDAYPGESDLADFRHDAMFNIEDAVDAKAFVEWATRDATIKDLKEATALAFGISGKRLQVRRSRRGGSRNAAAASKFCRMLAALDSVHDFRSGRKCGLPVERILAFEGLAVADFDPCLQAAMTSGLRDFETAVVHALKTRSHITFEGDVLPNLLRGCDLTVETPFATEAQMRSGWSKYYAAMQGDSPSSRQLPLEIWTVPHNGKAIILLKQLLAFQRKLKAFFGGSPRLLFDSTVFPEDMIVKLCTGSSLVTEALLGKFRLVDPFDVGPEDRNALSRLRTKVNSYWDHFPTEGAVQVITCDASKYDAALEGEDPLDESPLEVPCMLLDVRPTGHVPHCDGITLVGCAPDGNVRLVIDGQKVLLDPKYSAAISSKNNVIKRLLNKSKRKPELPNILNVLSLEEFASDTLDEFLRSVPKHVQLSLKRAGDWGQVQHCRQTGAVFVTRDRLAALYAYATGTACIFYRNGWKRDFAKHMFTFTRALP